MNLPLYDNYIDGRYVPPRSGEYFDSVNPTTAQAWYRAARSSEPDVTDAVRAARRAFTSDRWRRLTPTARGALLRKMGDRLGECGEELALLESTDNGKLLREMREQLAGLPNYYYYFGGLADKVHGDVIPGLNNATLNYTLREPLGVVGAITPWNAPLLLTTSKIAPALAAGNTVVIKPSEHSSASILRLAALFDEAGFPPGVVNVVTGFGAEAGNALVADPDVAKISFTGSTATGTAIGEACASRLARYTCELGGKSANIVFSDADVPSAAMGIVAGIFAAGGQTCVAGSRVFVARPVFDEVLSLVTARAESIRIGDPLDAETELGPLAMEAQLAKVERYVSIGTDEGASLVCGGKRPAAAKEGFFFEPTVFVDSDNSMTICQDEIFGPVAMVMPFDTEEEVIGLANATSYGLAAGLWTRDINRAHRLAGRLDVGTVWVNTYRTMTPMTPRSGFKSSGLGVEHGVESMNEYTRYKSVLVNTSDEPATDPFVLRT